MRQPSIRVRQLVVAVTIACAAAGAAGAAGSTPNVTGAWSPQSGPAWHLAASSDLSTLTASWKGAAGHESLRGSFSGTLNSEGSAYNGTMHVVEGATDVHGTMRFTINSASSITVTYHQANGVGGTIPLTRAAQSAPRWSYRGYANDVKVAPPLVGPFQLGVSHSSGSGTGAQGTVTTRFTPKNQQRYGGPYSFTASVTSFSYHASAHGTTKKLVLHVTITQTNGPKCQSGDTGTLTLTDSSKKLSNGERQDKAEFAWDHARCPGFVQGWSNADGGVKTSPHYGGPPHGGQWAIV
jgi:hypothetical protein